MTTTEAPTVITAIIGREFHYARTSAELEAVLDLLLVDGESQVFQWDRPCRQSKDGAINEFPADRLRLTCRDGWGALNYMSPGAHGDLVDSLGAEEAPPVLPFDEEGDLWFPRSASLPLAEVREAVAEFCRTGLRPTCVRWQPGHWY
ncbi:Imm1 family immunity protein [Saccharopolyspora cebuensis]|uniref:Imm1 family immunity protein n=1 Tax=Saccharopolyspora cebuensis TaxID=418759 RepID=A0ABV4CDS9_9PSEU